MTAPTQHCPCKMLGTRIVSPCKAHEAMYIQLAALALNNYQAFRRRAEMPPPEEVESCQ